MWSLKLCNRGSRDLLLRITTASHRASTTDAAQVDEISGQDSTEVKPFSQIPGPKGLYNIPFLGTAFHFKPFTKYVPDDLLNVLSDARDKYGDIVKMRMGKDYIVYVYHPDYAKTVFQFPYKEHLRIGLDLSETFHDRSGVPRDLGTLQGDAWAALRKPSQEKMLRPAVVANYVPLIERVTNDFVEELRKKGSVDDLLKELMNYTTESVAMLCFNRRLGYLESNSDTEIVNLITKFFIDFQTSITMPFKTYKLFRTKLYKRFEKTYLDIYRIGKKEISAQRKMLEKLQKEGDLDQYLQDEPNFIYSLLNDTRMTDEKINSVIMSLFIAGIDSTANTIAFVLINLALNPEKQDRLYQEIKETMGDENTLTKEHLAEMSYLKACVKESQRLVFPLMLGAIRYLEEDIVLAGYHIPKNTLVHPNMNSMTLDERFYPRPTEYIPERWIRDTNDDIAKGQDFPFGMMPFGFGPRGCIGQRFAETEMYIGVAKVIQNFKIALPPGVTGVKTKLKTFTTPAESVCLHLTDRNISNV